MAGGIHGSLDHFDHQVAPGEAHERLALVERRHAVLRKAIEVYLSDRKLNNKKGIREAITHIIPQQNGTPSVAGFSPSQWVLGYQPELSHLLDTNLNLTGQVPMRALKPTLRRGPPPRLP